MEARKKKRNRNKVSFIVIFMFIFNINIASAQTQILSISAREDKDSLLMIIENKSKVDTVLFSLYEQIKIKKKWVTSNYDLFCDVNNPNTSIFIIYPNQKIDLRAMKSNVIYTDEKIGKCKFLSMKSKRMLLVGNIKGSGTSISIHSDAW